MHPSLELPKADLAHIESISAKKELQKYKVHQLREQVYVLEHVDDGENNHDGKTVEGDESHEYHEQDSLWKALMEQLSYLTLPADETWTLLLRILKPS